MVRFLTILLFCSLYVVLWAYNTCQAAAENLNRRARHVSSYQKMENAQQDVKRLKSKGIEAYFREVSIPDKGTWYRVFAAESNPQARTRPPVKDKKRPPTSVKPAADSPDSRVKESLSPAPKPNSNQPDRTAKDIPGKPQPTPGRNVPPAEKPQKSDPQVDLKAAAGPPQIHAPDCPASPGYESAKAEFDARRYERAIAILSSLLARKQNDAAQYENALRLLADCYYFLGAERDSNYMPQAAESYKNILHYYPDPRRGNDVANFRLADSLERMGSYEEAYTAYSNVLTKYPDSPLKQDALYRIGKVLYLTKRYTHAADKLRNYLTSCPDGPSAFQASFLLGYCLRQTNRQPDGDSWYRNALTRWNNFEDLPLDVLHDLGLYLLSQRDYAGSANLFTLCFNLQSDGDLRRSALYNLGRSYYFSNRFSPALKVFSLLLESYPETLEANESILFMANIGVIDPKTEFNACMTGRDYFKNPIETYDWMRARYPGGRLEEWLLYQKGYALWKAGRHRDALDLYCTILDSFPHGRLQAETRGYLALNAKRLIEEASGKGDFLAIADLYYRIRNKILLSPETTEMFFKMGDSLWRIGLKPDAVAVLDRLKQSGHTAAAQQAILDLIMMELTYSSGEITQEKWNALLAEFAKKSGETTNSARKNIADYFYRKGQYDKAIALYDTLPKGEADFLPIARNQAHALKNSKSCPSAIHRYLEIINKCKENPQKCDPGFLADVYAGLGDCYYETADYEHGLAMYQQALPGLKEKDSTMWTRFRMGQSHSRMNDPAMAGKTFAELKEKSGDGFWPKVADFWIADEAWSRNNHEYLKKN